MFVTKLFAFLFPENRTVCSLIMLADFVSVLIWQQLLLSYIFEHIVYTTRWL